MSAEYYVYLHIRKDTGAVFYIGKGKGRRAFWSSQRNRHWHAIAQKAGFNVSFVSQGLTEEEAFRIEKETISHYGRCSLANYTDGGDGASGAKKSEEHKAMMREKMTGRKFSPETIEKIRQAAKARSAEARAKHAEKLRGRKHSEDHKRKIAMAGVGRVLSKEARAKISAYHAGRRKSLSAVAKMAASKSKAIRCHNNNETYASMSEAARALGLKQSHISDVCHGRSRHTKGFVFSRA
jgi:hypothetical protein